MPWVSARSVAATSARWVVARAASSFSRRVSAQRGSAARSASTVAICSVEHGVPVGVGEHRAQLGELGPAGDDGVVGAGEVVDVAEQPVHQPRSRPARAGGCGRSR